jgi:hypothetical protein
MKFIYGDEMGNTTPHTSFVEEVHKHIGLGIIMKIEGGITLDPNLTGSLLAC